jgi:hypothetical protein
MRTSEAFSLVATVVVLGCNVTDALPTGVAPPPDQHSALPSAGFTANVHGSTWVASRITAKRLSGGVIEIAGVGANAGGPLSITLRIASANGTGAHSLAASGDGSSLLVGETHLGPDFRWSTLFFSGYGTVTIASLSAAWVSGAFSGIADPENGQLESLSITDGTFTVSF